METEGGGLFFKSGIDNKQFDAAIAESTKRIQGMSSATVEAGAKMDKVYQNLTSESTNFSNIVKQNAKEEMGRIEELRASITKLTDARDKSTSIEKIEQYNKRIQEETEDLKELTNAGKKHEDETESLTQSIGKWALGLGGAAAILGTLKNALLETTGGLNLFNNISAVSKQALNDIVTGAGLSIDRLTSALAIQQQFNALRTEGYGTDFKAAQLNNKYQKEYAESLDATLSREDRIKKIDEALKTHDESIEVRSEHVRKSLAATAKALENNQDSEKYKKEYASLMTELINLDTERYESTKRLIRQRSILVKEGEDETAKFKKDIHKGLQKAADEQIEINNSIPEQIKLLSEAIESGNTKEIKAIAERIKVLQKELDIRTEIAKAALLSAFTEGKGAVTKVSTGNIHVNVPFVAPTLPGLQNATTEAHKIADLGKARQWNAEDLENDEKKKKNQQEILDGARQLTQELGKQLGLDDSSLEALDSMISLLSGDYIEAATEFFSTLIRSIPTQASKFQAQIDAINASLEKQQKLIDESQRAGGEKDARQKELDILNKKKAELEAQAAKDRKKMTGFDLFGSVERARKDLFKVNAQLDETNEKIKEAQQGMNDFLTGGITENTLADAIAEGFRSGETSADGFADHVNKVVLDALMNVFTAQTLLPLINQKLMPVVADAMADGVLTPEELAGIKSATKTVTDLAKPAFDAIQGLGLDEGASSGKDALTGAIKGVTEETASVLAGQVNAIRITQADSNSLIRQQLSHLSEIAANTRYLISIDNKLSGGKSESLRSQGLA